MADMTHLDRRIIVSCPIWHSPYFSIVPGGIEIKCKSCRGVIDTVARAKIEQGWKELDDQVEQERVPHD